MLTPWMPQKEVATLDMIFALKRPERVLEYGVGGSTVRWSGLPFIDKWLTIEHDIVWAQKTASQCNLDHNSVEIRRVDVDPAEGYVTAPLMDAPFDLIYVDGRNRVACVKASVRFLAPHGIVIMHDVWQNDHAQALGTFPHEIILGAPTRMHNGFLVMWGDV